MHILLHLEAAGSINFLSDLDFETLYIAAEAVTFLEENYPALKGCFEVME